MLGLSINAILLFFLSIKHPIQLIIGLKKFKNELFKKKLAELQ